MDRTAPDCSTSSAHRLDGDRLTDHYCGTRYVQSRTAAGGSAPYLAWVLEESAP